VSKPAQAKARVVSKASTKKSATRGVVDVGSTTRKQPALQNFVVEGMHSPSKLTVTFGDVSVQVTRPSDEAVQKGVRTSAKVIKDLGKRLLTPGVDIKQSQDVPVFKADPHDPSRVIRQLNGKLEVGYFVRGKFKANAA
jgi:hypothetical protein